MHHAEADANHTKKKLNMPKDILDQQKFNDLKKGLKVKQGL